MSGRTEVVTSDRPLREETPAGQRLDPITRQARLGGLLSDYRRVLALA